MTEVVVPVDRNQNPRITFDFLRNCGRKPQWFGLGFIQMKLNDVERIHFWHPDLSADTPEEELHDHRYEFTSTIIRGSLTHETWEFVSDPDGDHVMVQVACEPGVEVPPMPLGRGCIRRSGAYTMQAGSNYTFAPDDFHRVRSSRAVTLLRRGPKVKDYARVIKPVGQPTVCPFSRTISEHELWEYIADLMADDHTMVPTITDSGYHLRRIAKGVIGEPSKIREEAEEFIDAIDQGVSIMALVELADLYGAMRSYLSKYHPSINMEQLAQMSAVTARAFANGHR